jgi:hypothetical protein
MFRIFKTLFTSKPSPPPDPLLLSTWFIAEGMRLIEKHTEPISRITDLGALSKELSQIYYKHHRVRYEPTGIEQILLDSSLFNRGLYRVLSKSQDSVTPVSSK